MRYLILADMHGNWDAFLRVLEDAREVDFDEILVLGDLVGYGASPNEIVEQIRGFEQPFRAIRGNHDKVVTGIDDGVNFNPTALQAARWTTEALSEDNLSFVRDLPQGPAGIAEDLVICHGSLLDEDEYLLSAMGALESLGSREEQLTFFGHTHIPSLFAYKEEDGQMEVAVLEGEDLTLDIEDDTRYMLNPGSVGQPRDRDPRASYMIYDVEARQVRLRRVEYPIEEAQSKIRDAGLPGVLADRLAVGV